MKAIFTKYLGPTDTKPQRIKAYDIDRNSVTISTGLLTGNSEQNCRLAAEKLCEKMGWNGRLVSGGTKEGYVFCFDPDSDHQ